MSENKNKAVEYRQKAVQCLELAQRMSLRQDREQMMQIAQQWISEAQKAEQQGD